MANLTTQDIKLEGSTAVGEGNTITRCDLRNCTITKSGLRRSSFEDCVLAHVRTAHRTTGTKSYFHNVLSVKRTDFKDSIVRDGTSARRSTVNGSILRDQSSIKRSTVLGSTVSHSQLWRVTLSDCDVEECVISRSDFKGMTMKYGVWKKGLLVGRVGDKKPVIMATGESTPNIPSSHNIAQTPAVLDKDKKSYDLFSTGDAAKYVDSDASLDSSDSD